MISLADDLTHSLNMEPPVFRRYASAYRFYSTLLQQDLLGDWTITQSWGGKFNRRGGGQIRVVEDFVAGLKMMQTIALQRERHGYRVMPS